MAEALRTPAVLERPASLGAEPVASTPEGFAAFPSRGATDLARALGEGNVTAG